MPVRATSVQAYRQIEKEGKVATQSQFILDIMKDHPEGLIRQEISERGMLPINAVCGRVNELIKAGILMEDGRRKNLKTGKSSMVVKRKFVGGDYYVE